MSTTSAAPDMRRALTAEFIGTLLLVAGVVGSGIMAQRLTHDMALALLCNTVATSAILAVLVLSFAPISGAHFNPAVTVCFAALREMPMTTAIAYVAVQIAGGICGTWLAHAMFDLPVFAAGATMRTGHAQWLAEAVATAGLVLTIFRLRARGERVVAAGVSLYIGAAYWFTASTSFANPAVTIARALTPTFAGIRPMDVPMFVAAQAAGAAIGLLLARLLADGRPDRAA